MRRLLSKAARTSFSREGWLSDQFFRRYKNTGEMSSEFMGAELSQRDELCVHLKSGVPAHFYARNGELDAFR